MKILSNTGLPSYPEEESQGCGKEEGNQDQGESLPKPGGAKNGLADFVEKLVVGGQDQLSLQDENLGK